MVLIILFYALISVMYLFTIEILEYVLEKKILPYNSEDNFKFLPIKEWSILNILMYIPILPLDLILRLTTHLMPVALVLSSKINKTGIFNFLEYKPFKGRE